MFKLVADLRDVLEWEDARIGAISAGVLRDVIAALEAAGDAIAEEREACALAVEARGRATKNWEWVGNNHAAGAFAECIRARNHIADAGKMVSNPGKT